GCSYSPASPASAACERSRRRNPSWDEIEGGADPVASCVRISSRIRCPEAEKMCASGSCCSRAAGTPRPSSRNRCRRCRLSEAPGPASLRGTPARATPRARFDRLTNEPGDVSQPFDDGFHLRCARGAGQRGAEVLLQRHGPLRRPMPLPDLEQGSCREGVLIGAPDLLSRHREMVL